MKIKSRDNPAFFVVNRGLEFIKNSYKTISVSTEEEGGFFSTLEMAKAIYTPDEAFVFITFKSRENIQNGRKLYKVGKTSGYNNL